MNFLPDRLASWPGVSGLYRPWDFSVPFIPFPLFFHSFSLLSHSLSFFPLFSFPLPFRLSLLCFPAPSRASVIAMWTQGNCQFSDRLGALGRQPGPNPLRTDRIMPCVILQHRFLGHSGGTRSQAVSSLATPRSPGNTDSWGGGGEGCTWASFTWRHPWVSISFPGDPSQRPAL